MTSTALPIAGHPYLALAAQTDSAFHRRIIANLRKRGFTVENQRLVPPTGADAKAIITAIKAAFQEARPA